MKIHGTAKGGALSTKDFGVAFGGAAAAFSPTDISDLFAWYDASDIDTITKSGANVVSNWANKEGTSSRDLDDGNADPLWVSADRNGLDVINFASNKFLETSSAWSAISQPNTIFFVLLTPNGLSTNQDWLFTQHKDESGDSHALVVGDGTNYKWDMRGGALITFTDAAVCGNWQYITMVYNNLSSDIRFGGVSKATGDASGNDFSGLTMASYEGGSNFANTKYGEFIVYDKLLTSGEISQVEDYLSEKWGF